MTSQRKSDILDNLTPFKRAYIDCALWCGVLGPDADAPDMMVYDCEPEQLTHAALATMIADCEDFLGMDGVLNAMHATGADDTQHGHDLWLTRNGHGTGFWDRGYGEPGAFLTRSAKALGSRDLYLHRNRIYAC